MSGWQLCGTFVKKVIGDSLAWSLQFAVPFDYKIFSRSDVLVTGGLGFIGSSLARRLVTLDANVTLVDSLIPEYGGNLFNIHDIRDCVTVNLADVRDPQTMTSLIKRRNFLFNLAGQTSHLDSMTDPLTDLNINAAAQLSILEACRMHNRDVKIVFASTRQLYGRPQYLPVDEKHPVDPVDVNGINKLAGERYHLLYNSVYKIRACALRLTNTYGHGMRVKDARQTFLGVWIRHLIEGKPIQIFGSGTQRRDFNFIDDVVEAFLLAAAEAASEGEVFNLGHNEHISLQELAALLVRLNNGGQYEIVPFPANREAIDIGDYYGDFSKIQTALGWSPQVSLRTGLAHTLEYYKKHGAHYWGSTP
ncbi:MAG: NAD-dependent epimerase [Verrucomicrobia bacterium]|nr:MAG: NAD-dependent epimerase [Verrucomicrobiota bacterium]PYK33012.1 MAG: NAD-dependent epimerase [Verrucomicrobiota bacterium]PYL81595.1 MAG: NAD-dependent epimerase [Verrucomicrobiota bacterium]